MHLLITTITQVILINHRISYFNLESNPRIFDDTLSFNFETWHLSARRCSYDERSVRAHRRLCHQSGVVLRLRDHIDESNSSMNMKRNTHTKKNTQTVNHVTPFKVLTIYKRLTTLTYSADGLTPSSSGPILDKQSGAAIALDLPALYLNQT